MCGEDLTKLDSVLDMNILTIFNFLGYKSDKIHAESEEQKFQIKQNQNKQ
ncbi:hypothetical protein EZS27_016880 [termite gut metagenome]|uniref:Uncharacterized protein n=1 Tax=termite gut metagenome TaxID=433724 RepID=A0A5J4RMF2_9ZZZZ